MRQQFQQTKVRDLVSNGALFVTDGYRMRNVELASTGIPFVRGGDIGDGSINTATDDHIAPQFTDRIANKLSQPGDVVFITKGTVGRVGFLRSNQPQVVFAPQVCCWRAVNREALEPRFVFYLLKSAEFQANLDAVKTHGSMVADYVSLRDQMNFDLTIPPIAEQRAIAWVLGALDDKIELNRRMNETLEALAQTLFKSWFVDPTADGLPNGWRIRKLAELVTIDKGLSYKGEFLSDAGVPMVNLGCFKGSGSFAADAMKFYTGEFQQRHVVKPGDLVIANTDITQKRNVLGSPGIVPPLKGCSELLFTHHVFAARFQADQNLWKLFVYHSLLQDNFRERATGFATGTTVLALPRDAVLDLDLATPPGELVDAFNKKAIPLLERRWLNDEESRTLAALRDALLPKLLSGELRIGNIS